MSRDEGRGELEFYTRALYRIVLMCIQVYLDDMRDDENALPGHFLCISSIFIIMSVRFSILIKYRTRRTMSGVWVCLPPPSKLPEKVGII